ncbi:MAG: DUF4405 domain-containing protein [Chloroflexi bacterium]|nr:DUF4405 domain-containing protein [Chloroflexota bacterium]
MSKVRLLFVVAVSSFLVFLLQAISGFVLWLILPRGSNGDGVGRGGSTFVWSRQTWMDIHEWTAVALLVLLVIHIYMHWKWLLNQAKALFKTR